MTKLALIRHGPTVYTETQRIQGVRDVPLSEGGRVQIGSYRVPPELEGFVWLASPLSRALETAQVLASGPVHTDPRLMEMDWGGWEGRTLEDLRAELGQAMRDNENRGWDFCPENGESPREVMNRIGPLLAEIGKRGHNTAAVTHKGVIRAIFAAALDWDMRGPPPHNLDWSSAHLFNVSDLGAPSLFALNIPLVRATETVATATR